MMSNRPNLDIGCLRSFVAGFDLGSFARAAERVGRSQSAVSTQLRRLEEQAGQRLVQKAGRGLRPTLAGENLLAYARKILELNDEAVAMLRDGRVAGSVRLGVPQDFAESALPSVLGRFARAHPKVRIEVFAERNVALLERLRRGDVDLALTWDDGEVIGRSERLVHLPLAYVAHPDCPALDTFGTAPLPLIAFEHPCLFRSLGTARLDAAGVAWRIVFTSPSLSALWAAAEAGLGVTIRAQVGVPRSLRALDPAVCGLPPLPMTALVLHHAASAQSPAVSRLAEIVTAIVAEEALR